jgi:hypothetical protein
MVNKDHINDLLVKYFHARSKITILDTGVVNAHGSVHTKAVFDKLPVKFGQVDGNFDCSTSNLKTLEGAPDRCEGDFDCSQNQLTSLAHAPSYVQGRFWCNDNPLTSLEHLPAHVGGLVWCTPSPQLPILRLCMYEQVDFDDWDPKLAGIMEKYVGTGKAAAIKAATELIKAGFKGNARW